MMILSLCTYCNRRRAEVDRGGPAPVPTCAAFPDGVPDEIAFKLYDHRQPFEGDRGILFKGDEREAEAFMQLAAKLRPAEEPDIVEPPDDELEGLEPELEELEDPTLPAGPVE